MRTSVGIFLMHATMQRFQKGKCLVECDPRSIQRCQTRLKIGEIIFYEHTAALKHLTKAKQVSLHNVPDYNSFCLEYHISLTFSAHFISKERVSKASIATWSRTYWISHNDSMFEIWLFFRAEQPLRSKRIRVKCLDNLTK